MQYTLLHDGIPTNARCHLCLGLKSDSVHKFVSDSSAVVRCTTCGQPGKPLHRSECRLGSCDECLRKYAITRDRWVDRWRRQKRARSTP